jgi:AcrR family transcriptional regulator
MIDETNRRGGIRARLRIEVRDEVKRIALRQLADGGPQTLSVNAIAKELGVSGPALYRYFKSKDDLLTELVLDAYGDLADAVEAETRRQRPAQRLAAFARAYRAWAVAEPHRYRLLYARPTPGYDAHRQSLVDAAQRLMALLLDDLGDAPAASAKRPPAALAGQLTAWARTRGIDVDPAVAHRAIVVWSRLHGLVSLEIEGNFASMGVDAELLLEGEIAALSGPG